MRGHEKDAANAAGGRRPDVHRGAIYLTTLKPKQRPASTEKVDSTLARLERGRYLAEVVFGCFDCHSKHDLNTYGAPAVGPVGQGGECVGETQGFPGQAAWPT
jgi:hypothetical protein